MTVLDVDYNVFINALANKLKADGKLAQPDWTQFVKTGVTRQYSPNEQNWYYLKAAAILRRVYIQGPLGIKDFRKIFASEKQSCVGKSHHVLASGKLCRVIC